MSPRRLAVFALLAAALLPGAAQAAVPVALYPVRVPGLSKEQRSELSVLLQAALLSGVRRGALQPRTPLVLAHSCGEAPAPACLRRLAGEGVVLVASGHRSGGTVLMTAALYDRYGAKTRNVRFVADLVIENLRPINDALAQLEGELAEDGTVAGAPRPPPEPAAARPVAAAPKPSATPAKPTTATSTSTSTSTTPTATASATPTSTPTSTSTSTSTSTPTATASATPTPTPTPTPTAKPKPLDVSAPAEPPPVWKRQAGPFFTIAGALAVASGGAVAIANRSLSNDLNAKRAAGTLTTADRASYDRVDRYNVLSTVLLAGGGVSLAAGTWIWITAPARPGDPALAVAGGHF